MALISHARNWVSSKNYQIRPKTCRFCRISVALMSPHTYNKDTLMKYQSFLSACFLGQRRYTGNRKFVRRLQFVFSSLHSKDRVKVMNGYVVQSSSDEYKTKKSFYNQNASEQGAVWCALPITHTLGDIAMAMLEEFCPFIQLKAKYLGMQNSTRRSISTYNVLSFACTQMCYRWEHRLVVKRNVLT